MAIFNSYVSLPEGILIDCEFNQLVQHLTFQALAAAAGGLARLAEGGPSQAVRGRVQVEFGAVLCRKHGEFAWIYKYGNVEDEKWLEHVEDVGTNSVLIGAK